MRRVTLTLFAASALACLPGTLLGNEPLPPNVTIVSRLAVNGTSFLHLQNLEKNQLILLISAGPLSSINFPAKRVTLGAGLSADIDLGILPFLSGVQTFHVVSRIYDGARNLPVGLGPFLLEPLNNQGGVIQKISYEDAFLSKRLRVPNADNPNNQIPAIYLGGGFREQRAISALAFRSSSVGGTAGQTYNSQFEALSIADAFQGKTNPDPGSPGSGTILGNPICTFSCTGVVANTPKPALNSPIRPLDGPAFVIKGKFFLKLPGPTYQAAWGWEAKAWQQVGPLWVFLGWSYVGGDGSWSIPVLPGFPVRVEYQPANRFVQLQDANGNVYTWGDNWTLTGSVTDIGGRSADFTANGDLPGVDKLYVGATDEWIKFYNNNLNALRDSPIQVTFPNSLASGKCQQTDSSGKAYAWSCSQWSDGKIWIIPAHADKSVVQHEIAHSINSYYWNGNLPSGAGGAHNLTDCYNNGLALTEGFADFIAYWVQFGRTSTSPVASYFNESIETLPSGTCSGQTAEMRVAATLWDTYDYWNDGSDTNTKYDSLYYVNEGSTVSIYLNNSENKMADYLGVMKSGQSAYWQGEFEKLFRLNTIIN